MKANWLIIAISALVAYMLINGWRTVKKQSTQLDQVKQHLGASPDDTVWRGPAPTQIPYYSKKNGPLIYYGYELIHNTAYYLGPHGKVAQIANSLNCQNCHLDAGTRPFAYNFGKVFATYPMYRARNNKIQTLYDRINDCMTRSMNGSTLNIKSREMQAIYAYIQWLDKEVSKGTIKGGTQVKNIPFMDTAANVNSGKLVFIAKCQICHGRDGQGQLDPSGNGYTYPPLWGKQSYNDGAGMFRLTKIAAFVFNNMPYGTNYHHPDLTIEQAWNVGAFVNSQPRPHYDAKADWLDLNKKPMDYPYGPYMDHFSDSQHKYGPYKPMIRKTK